MKRMQAAVAHYLDGKPDELRALPLADRESGEEQAASDGKLSCDRDGLSRGAANKVGEQLMERSPYAWGGVGDMSFRENGVLETPWGKGEWGVHSGDASGNTVWADFVGAKHNVRFMESRLGVSTRCSDNNLVLVRSIKNAKAAEKKR